jgi:hypothetical protein
MLTLSWRKVGRSTALTLVLVVGLPALVQAQLFPNMWIKRQRQDCANEPPFYGHVRQNYFGYYPTCWRKFPEGWGCPGPNDEVPNAAKEFALRPRDAVPEFPPDIDDLMTPRGGRGAAPSGGTEDGPGGDRRPLPNIPGAPTTGAPFRGDRDLTTPDVFTTPGLPRPTTPGTPPPSGRPVPPPGDTQPFDPVRPPMPRSSNDSGPLPRVSNLPSLEGPASDRSITASVGGPTLLDGDGTSSNGAVLALPSMTPPTRPFIAGDSLVVSSMPPSLPPGGTYVEPTDSASAPAQAPRRPSLIGSLFSRFRR